MTTLLVDGDQYIHRVCAATERDVKWDDQNHVLMSNEEEAWETLQAAFGELRERFGNSAELVVCTGQSPYFRHSIYPAYKPGRGRKPLAFSDIKARVQAEYKTIEYDGLEADDVMGILATRPGNDAIIVARDKDMKGVPAKLWDGKDFHNVTKDQADYFHMYQTLTGDTTDGYKGCPGVGPVKATKILNNPVEIIENNHQRSDTVRSVSQWVAVVSAFEEAGLTEDDALLQARLARILRWEDWDNKKKAPILWDPTI